MELYIAIILLASVIEVALCNPSVTTKYGVIEGMVEEFESDFFETHRKVDVYNGIPYARPPTGPLRFKKPQPLDPWDGIYIADDLGPACTQPIRDDEFAHVKLSSPDVSEDCLYLDVYVPKPTPPKAAVMVWIHGGGFSYGAGLRFPTNPIPLVALGDVIVITINYRLGPFGFLTTGDEEIPANLGLHDQRAAFQWVQDNIEFFGGDPKRITLFGESAGGSSIGYHLMSPGSRPLFQRAILQSGTPIDLWAKMVDKEEALWRAKEFAKLVGCSMKDLEDTAKLAKCLTQTASYDLNIMSNQLEEIFPLNTLCPWVPVVDGHFFSAMPSEMLEAGSLSNEHDIMIGNNEHEGSFRTYTSTGQPLDPPFVDEDQFFKSLYGMEWDREERELLKVMYLEEEKLGDKSANFLDALIYSAGDMLFTCSFEKFSKYLTAAGGRVYQYMFTHIPQNPIYFKWPGAGHIEELQYLFGLPLQNGIPMEMSEDEKNMAAYIIQYWTNFAKTGDPNLLDTKEQPPFDFPEWPTFTDETRSYKVLDLKLENKQYVRAKRCFFWNQVLPQWKAVKEELKKLKETEGHEKFKWTKEGNE